MKRLLILILVCFVMLTSCEKVYRYTEYDFYSMTTFVNIVSDSEDDFEEIKAFADDFEARLSRTSQNSEIFLLNNKGEMSLSDDARYILEKSLEISDKTEGAFNPCMGALSELWDVTSGKENVPADEAVKKALETCKLQNVTLEGNDVRVTGGTKLDLGGVAKGYALQQMLEISAFGRENANVCINLGGNVGVMGSSKNNREKGLEGWNVGLTNPFDRNEIAGTLVMSDGFLAVSGAYERFFEKDGTVYHHIFDPESGYPAKSDLSSVAIVSKSGLEADALSTALFVMGLDKAVEFYNSGKYDFEMILISENGEVFVSEGIFDKFTVQNGAENINGEKQIIIKL